MARSKTRVVGFDDDGRLITVQLELPNGEVVKGHYKVYFWHEPPSDITEEIDRRIALPPVTIAGKRSEPDQ